MKNKCIPNTHLSGAFNLHTLFRILKGIIKDGVIVGEKEHCYDYWFNVFDEAKSHTVNNL